MNRSAPTRAPPPGRLGRHRCIEGQVVENISGEEKQILLHETDIERRSAVESDRMSTPSTVILPRSGS